MSTDNFDTTTVTRLAPQNAAEYLHLLKRLIDSTIELPSEAISHFKNQWTEESLANAAARFVFLMAERNGEKVGIVLGTPVEGGVGTIVWVLVDRTQQKTGAGALLFKTACDLYKKMGAHKVKLTVPDEATTAFYRKQGMIIEGVHRNHWWKHDFWSMGIEL